MSFANRQPHSVVLRKVIHAAVLISTLAGCAEAQPHVSVALHIESLRAPGYGTLDSAQCPSTDLSCMAAASQNAGPAPARAVDAFKRSFPAWVKFVDQADGARKVWGGIIELHSNPLASAVCTVAGVVTPGKETDEVAVSIDPRYAPPYGTSATEKERRDVATALCLGGLGKRMAEQL